MRLIFLVIWIFISLSCHAEKYSYDPIADPYQLLAESTEAALKEDKLILVVFGSDWCPDCRSFNEKLDMKPLSEIITRRFVVMHVDIGKWDRNIEFTNKFGSPIDGGIPSIAILANDKVLYYVAEGGEFASARKSKVKTLNEWFISLEQEITKKSNFRSANKPLQPTANASAE
jgi:thioredoxin 1